MQNQTDFVVMKKKKRITSGRCLNKSSAEKPPNIIRPVGFSHFSYGTTWKQLNYYVNVVIIPIFLVYMSHKHKMYREKPRRIMLWNSISSAVILPIEFTVSICCDSQLSQTFLSRANRSHVTTAQHYGNSLCFWLGLLSALMSYISSMLCLFNEIHSQNEHYLK